jgi:hypothetical protein
VAVPEPEPALISGVALIPVPVSAAISGGGRSFLGNSPSYLLTALVQPRSVRGEGSHRTIVQSELQILVLFCD